MKRLIALMALLGTLTACSAPAEPAATEQKETPAAEESVTAEPPRPWMTRPHFPPPRRKS